MGERADHVPRQGYRGSGGGTRVCVLEVPPVLVYFGAGGSGTGREGCVGPSKPECLAGFLVGLRRNSGYVPVPDLALAVCFFLRFRAVERIGLWRRVDPKQLAIRAERWPFVSF